MEGRKDGKTERPNARGRVRSMGVGSWVPRPSFRLWAFGPSVFPSFLPSFLPPYHPPDRAVVVRRNEERSILADGEPPRAELVAGHGREGAEGAGRLSLGEG